LGNVLDARPAGRAVLRALGAAQGKVLFRACWSILGPTAWWGTLTDTPTISSSETSHRTDTKMGSDRSRCLLRRPRTAEQPLPGNEFSSDQIKSGLSTEPNVDVNSFGGPRVTCSGSCGGLFMELWRLSPGRSGVEPRMAYTAR
jgi:hypothetical protein